MHRPTCPRAGCGREIHPASVACPSCYRLVPQAIRVDLDHCLRTQRAWTADPLWQRAYRAALKALALTVCESTAGGTTPAALERQRAARSKRCRVAAGARWSR